MDEVVLELVVVEWKRLFKKLALHFLNTNKNGRAFPLFESPIALWWVGLVVMVVVVVWWER